MTDLPRGPLGPLDPPPGAFEAVQRRAGRRRLQRAGTAGALSVALLAGAFAVGTQLAGTSRPDALVVAAPSVEPSPTQVVYGGITHGPTPTPTPSPEPEPQPDPVATSAAPDPVATTSAPTAEPTPITWRLRVRDPQGAPVEGAYVFGITAEGRFAWTLRTDAAGEVRTVCDASVRPLVAMWDLSLRTGMRQPRDMRNLAAAWALGGRDFADNDPYACNADSSDVQLVDLREGGVVTGQLRYTDADGVERAYEDGADPGGGLYCTALGIPGDRPQCASWDPRSGRYRFAGLPKGTFRLQGMYSGRDVEVRAGETTELDWYECDGCRDGARPTASP